VIPKRFPNLPPGTEKEEEDEEEAPAEEAAAEDAPAEEAPAEEAAAEVRTNPSLCVLWTHSRALHRRRARRRLRTLPRPRRMPRRSLPLRRPRRPSLRRSGCCSVRALAHM
jgi:hypothetical protein